MANFRDSNGNEWTIHLDGPAIMAVRLETDPEFLKGDPNETIERMRVDLVLLCEVVHALCKKQIAERGMTDEQFYKGVIGDTIDVATDALLKAVLDFIPSHTRSIVETCAAQNAKIREMATAKAIAAINDNRLLKQIEMDLEAEIAEQIKAATTRLRTASN